MAGVQKPGRDNNDQDHHVLISLSLIGSFTEKAFDHPNAKIIACTFHDASRLHEYDLVVLPYSEFYSRNDEPSPYKHIFEKQMLEALDNGTTFCFVHHDERVPGEWDDYGDDGYDFRSDVKQPLRTQAGFKWIFANSIRINRTPNAILRADVKRTEFNTFLTKWGTSHNYFGVFKDGKFDDVLYQNADLVIGFSIDWSRGNIIYLPFQANYSNSKDLKDSILCLVDSLLTYKAKRLREIPEWAQISFFESENALNEKRAALLAELKKLELQITPFQEAKFLLTANEHSLESSVPQFISKNMGIATHQIEKFVEDFWIIGEREKKLAICEVKSVTKGFKKSAIYDVYNHREKYELPEDFPGILFVNCNLQAGSWLKKDVPIQKEDYEIAAKNHVLIVRIEDLVRLWAAITEAMISKDDVVKILTTEKGWLQVKEGKVIIHN